MTVSFLFGAAVFMAVVLLYSIREEKRLKLKRRLERHLVSPQKNEFSITDLFGLRKFIEKLDRKLKKSGIKADAEEVFLWFLLLSVLSSISLSLKGFTALGAALPFMLYYLIDYILDYLGRRRVRKIEEQFKDFVKMLGAYLKMVPSFAGAFIKAAEEAESPLKEHTDRVVRKFELGEDIETALQELKNVESTYIKAWADSIIFAVRMKSDLSRVCERTAKKLYERIKMSNKIAAMTVQAKSLMVSLAGVMAVMIAVTMMSSPDFVKAYSTPAGRIVIAYAALSYFISTFYVLKKIDKEMEL
ncbi:type II secretion system F family protein [Thermoanaerobacter wiegelii]|uniref:Type II secretion system F domain-containing protein n=1 Tax=Thermoanaerobacter wiegelii Rt8.B1 TaxID=697303 RepID=G2MRL8_9THEO|nr:type II secretion system F family protein [Thermoanaerobacter wiegelii]AEM79749.1 Type II secretion system F domain-containing protein [Thermoanaerobacter wiegelii Rt8.B1]